MVHKNLHRLVVQTIILISTILLTSCTNTGTNTQESNLAEDSTKIERIESADNFFSIDDGFVYFGRETCSTCKSFLPILTEVTSDENIMMNYFDTGYFRENALLSESELQKIFTDYQVSSVPIVIEIRDGQLYDTFTPEFNEQRDNTTEVKESIKTFLMQLN
ncbi:MAG: thioredoxin family protein [Anaerotignum sp.]|nr:thioredoxin family protein [Anaerotignum sp.]